MRNLNLVNIDLSTNNSKGILKRRVIVSILFIMLMIFEIMSYTYGGIFTIISSRVWLFNGIICLIYILHKFFKIMYTDLIQHHFINFFGVLIYLAIFSYYLGNISYGDINPDATQQIASGLVSFDQIDWNYTGMSFLNYPNKQYLIAALPAYLFGRSIITLHMGFSIPFLVGLITLYLGFRKILEIYKLDVLFALIPMYMILTFPFISEYFLNFEQAIFPVSFTMIGLGLFINYILNPTNIGLFCLTWIGCMLSNIYTPGLASLGLLIVFMCYYVIELTIKLIKNNEKNRISIIIMTSISIMFILASFLIKQFSNNTNTLTMIRDDVDIFSFSIKSCISFCLDKDVIFLGINKLIFIVYIIFSLILFRNLCNIFISLWCLGVIITSNLLLGYTLYEPKWVIQRAMIIIPIFIVGLFINLIKYLKKKNLKYSYQITILIICFYMGIGIYNFNQPHQSFLYFRYVQPIKYMITSIEHDAKDNKITSDTTFNFILYTDNLLYKNLKDYFSFFYPNANIYYADNFTIPEGIDWYYPTAIFSEQEGGLELYNEKEKTIRYYDQRYSNYITWYYIYKDGKG